mgnify:CR=1 FL=1
MEDKKKRPKLKQKDIDKLYSIFLEQLDDKTLKTLEETIEEYGIKVVLETLFEWVILEAIPEVNNERIIPKTIKLDEKHWYLNVKSTEKCEEECKE